MYALSSYDAPIVWIAGGRADLNDYSALDDLVKQRVKSIICIGEEQNNIFNHYCTITSCKRELTFDDAVKSAYSEAEAGDIVLFAPACKSFDMFLNFEHRGEVFKELVMQL
jgi:UDP-N-acetylmuramoylalanine--D-glutamate ligase